MKKFGQPQPKLFVGLGCVTIRRNSSLGVPGQVPSTNHIRQHVRACISRLGMRRGNEMVGQEQAESLSKGRDFDEIALLRCSYLIEKALPGIWKIKGGY